MVQKLISACFVQSCVQEVVMMVCDLLVARHLKPAGSKSASIANLGSKQPAASSSSSSTSFQVKSIIDIQGGVT